MITQQVKVVLKKNLMLSIRSREIFVDAFFPLVVGLVISYVTNELNKVILGIPFISFTRSIVYQFVFDKAERFKEIQKIMGLKSASYNLSWLIYYYVRGFIACLFFLFPAAINGVLTVDGFDWVQGSIMYIANMYMNIHFAFFVSSLFSRPRLAAELYMLFSLCMTLFFYAGFAEELGQNHSVLMLLAFLIPQSAMMWAWLSNGWQASTQIIYFSFADGMLVITTMSIVYLVAFLYFDQIIQTEYGSSRHPLFFITDFIQSFQNSGKSKVRSLTYNELSKEDLSDAIYKEEVDKNKFKSSVQIKNLNKQYGNFTAVEKLSLTLFEKQIFCLLGHNGAGKTTTISLLTGLVKKTKGQVKIYDKDQDLDFEEMRSYIGLCTQKDSLYDQLTIEEHLAFIGQLKGKFDEELAQDIENVIMKCALNLQRGKRAGVLSGGNKRKLSMAMALIGGSKVIFLDEPSSGLDSLSRIQIRQIINDMRDSDRSIVLTTHHLEEVEELADRTAIMAKGKLLAVGTNDFIKKKFGIGYHLTLSKKNKVENQPQDEENQIKVQQNYENYEADKFLTPERCEKLKSMVLSFIPSAKYNPQSAKGTVVMTLPFDSKDKFVELFKTIETQYLDTQIHFELNTLEDAFINIGMEESKYLNNQEVNKEQEKFTDFENIKAPDCLNRAPRFLFFNQLWALFLRRLMVSFRSISMIFTFIFPLLCQVGGVVLTKQAFKDLEEDDPNKPFLQLSLNAAFQLLTYCLTMTGIAASPVIDNESRLRYALTVMGCRNTTYWMGAFIFDYLIMGLMLVVFVAILPLFDLPGLQNNIGDVSEILAISIFCFIGFSYLFSFVYSKSRWVYLTYPWVIFFIFFAGFQALFLYEKTTSDSLRWIYCLISPFLNTSNAMIVLALKQYQTNTSSWQKLFPGDFADNATYKKILIGQAFLYIILAIVIDYAKQQIPNKSRRQEDYSELEKDQVIRNQEIIDEDNRVAHPQCKDKIKVSKLYKTYYPQGKPFTAIQNNSFGVNNGEIMGLLGPNGAGKSTTFNIITSLIQKSSGSVKLKECEVKSGALDIYQDVGICPQFDSLYENLTVKDHLQLFGRMKGLYAKDLDDQVDYFIKIMQLTDYRNKAAGKLSGGNKRKLCVTIALIGGPDMQFFDEPSSGVDPIARRFLWNTLKMSLQRRNSAIVLTTHSMHEAETLCTKIGILVNGKFQCMGSPDFLKKKYGDGYRIVLKVKSEENAKFIHQQMTSELPDAERIVKYDGERVIYLVQYDRFSFYTTYKLLDRLCNTLSQISIASQMNIECQDMSDRNSINCQSDNIASKDDFDQQFNKQRISLDRKNKAVLESFQITESTLEQIFIQFSSHQAVKDEETENKVKRKKFFCF